jgi:hypothetical protein
MGATDHVEQMGTGNVNKKTIRKTPSQSPAGAPCKATTKDQIHTF